MSKCTNCHEPATNIVLSVKKKTEKNTIVYYNYQTYYIQYVPISL